jgi:hypothetical protein
MLYRKQKKLQYVRAHFDKKFNGVLPPELAELLQFITNQRAGRLGRARETVRNPPSTNEKSGQESKAA